MFVQEKRKVLSSSQKYPCTNYVLRCSKCNASVWKYNGANHYEDVHAGMEVPEDFKITKTEYSNMKKKRDVKMKKNEKPKRKKNS